MGTVTPSARTLQLLALLSLGALGLGGCAHKTQLSGPTRELYADKAAVLGIAIAPLPKGAAYRKGEEQQQLVGIVINNAVAHSLEAHLQNVNVAGLQPLADQLAEKLAARGLRVKKLTTVVDPQNFPELPNETGDRHLAERDYSSLKATEGIDRLLVLQVTQLGTSRSYYAFVPTGPLSAMVRAQGQVVELSSGRLLWNSTSERLQHIEGHWDDPPDYPNLDRAIAAALRLAGRDLVEDFVY